MSSIYTLSIFSFTSSRKKKELEQGLEGYEAVKRRRCVKEETDALDDNEENPSEEFHNTYGCL